MDREREIVAAVYSKLGKYSEVEGVSVSETALAVWQVLRSVDAHRDMEEANEDSIAVADRVLTLLNTASTVCSLLLT